MDNDIIVQFICFATQLERAEFATLWEPYARQLADVPGYIILQESAVAEKSGNKFKYVSQHKCSAADFNFAFLKGRSRTHFPEHKAKVVQAGGYTPLQLQCTQKEVKGDVKVIAFLTHSEMDLDFYRAQTYRHLNIYEAYFENCTYGYIMEFFLHEEEAPLLVKQLKTRVGTEAALYKESSSFRSSRKTSGSLLHK